MCINTFRGDFRFLSNFYPCRIQYQGVVYDSVEHAYQAAKTLDSKIREEICRAPTPGEARRLGRRIAHLNPGWDSIKLQVMTELVNQKFALHRDLRDKLLGTGEQQLIEGNNWGDTYWGVCRGAGENHMGRILMECREHWRRDRCISPVEY